MKTIHYANTTQKILGWYDKAIHINIPTPNIEVSDDVWQRAINENANYVDVGNKNVAHKDFRSDEEKATAVKNNRYSRLETIFNQKTTGLKLLAIDKPFMKNVEAINSQYQVYEKMYQNAKSGFYDDATNTNIITANEAAMVQLASLIVLLNSVRGVLEELIATDAVNTDEMLDTAEAITLTKEELIPEKISEIKSIFGL